MAALTAARGPLQGVRIAVETEGVRPEKFGAFLKKEQARRVRIVQDADVRVEQ